MPSVGSGQAHYQKRRRLVTCNVEDLAESLAEGIMTDHPSMPAFRFDPDQIENLIAYLKTLEKQ